MDKHFVLFCFVLFCFNGRTQGNLVPNNDFESYIICPNNSGQFGSTYVSDWINPSNMGTPEYYNGCASYTLGVSVPHNLAGYQPDKSGGGAYAGIYVFNKAQQNSGREYIQVKLNDTLMPGRKYLVNMYVSRNKFDFAISTMGMYFTNNAITQPTSTTDFINVPNPQVKNTTPLTDTLNWMLVQDTVTGTGTELYLTIGNFSYDSLSDTLRTVPFFQNGWYAYYYIDGVSVIDVAEIGVNEIDKKKGRMSIFPNPSTGEFVISSDNGYDEINLTVEDISGKIVYSGKASMENKQTKLKLDLQNGVYLLNIDNGDIREIRKLIISK